MEPTPMRLEDQLAMQEENNRLHTRLAVMEAGEKKKFWGGIMEYPRPWTDILLVLLTVAITSGIWVCFMIEPHGPNPPPSVITKKEQKLPCYTTGRSSDYPEPWETSYIFRCDTEELARHGGCPALKTVDHTSLIQFESTEEANRFAHVWGLELCK